MKLTLDVLLYQMYGEGGKSHLQDSQEGLRKKSLALGQKRIGIDPVFQRSWHDVDYLSRALPTFEMLLRYLPKEDRSSCLVYKHNTSDLEIRINVDRIGGTVPGISKPSKRIKCVALN